MIDVRSEEHCGAEANDTETTMLLFHHRRTLGIEADTGFEIRVFLQQKSSHDGN